jgi:hypothetical protein
MKGSDEWMTGIREGYRTKTIRVGNATIEIHRPILTEEERSKRENQVMDALKGFGKDKSYEK